MSNIVFLAPDSHMFALACSALSHNHAAIQVEQGLLSQGVDAAKRLVAGGAEVIITRGGTALAIRDAGLEVTLVEVPITGFDIIRAVEQAKAHGQTIGVVAFPSMILGIDCLSPILGVDIRLYPIYNEFEAEARVLQAFHEGVQVVIGGVITGQAAYKHGFAYIPITSGAEGILQAAQEAERIAYARQLEKAKGSLFRAVLDYAYEGVIAIDKSQAISTFNPVAERLTKIDRTQALGKKITQVWPELRLERVVAQGLDDLGQILKINGVDILCNKVAIKVDGTTVGAVATFQDAGQIQQMEARVRRRIYASGHAASYTFQDILGQSPQIQSTIFAAKEFAATQSAILILGETGTGKEVFAQSIHNDSSRRQGPFVAVNCAALPAHILESELFGYVAGAFTGASHKGKPGLFEIAHEGTIFLDEIGEMDYLTQGKLLRVLQEKKVMRLGSDKVLPIDVRIIAATNKSLKGQVNQNKFRADLYYRLNVLQLKLPPLRARPGDLEVFAQAFMNSSTAPPAKPIHFTPAALEALKQYPWPGNIRQLKNIIERITAVTKTPLVDVDLIHRLLADEEDEEQSPTSGFLLDQEVEEIKKALTEARGNRTLAARKLGISRSTLWRKLRQFGL